MDRATNGTGVKDDELWRPAPYQSMRGVVTRRFYGLFLFVLALSADILLVGMDVDTTLRLLTKPFIVVGLFLFFLRNGSRRGMFRWMLPALLLSWQGDVLLVFEAYDPLFFILGLGSFLLAHVAYCLFFTGVWRREGIRLRLPVVLGVAAFYAGLLLLLWPGLGPMKVPVAVYGFVISAMLLLALHTIALSHRKIGFAFMLGALLFVLSDSLLAVNRFYTPLPYAGILIMLTYGLAQWQLVKGALLYGTE